jgi:hypothetical protein
MNYEKSSKSYEPIVNINGSSNIVTTIQDTTYMSVLGAGNRRSIRTERGKRVCPVLAEDVGNSLGGKNTI